MQTRRIDQALETQGLLQDEAWEVLGPARPQINEPEAADPLTEMKDGDLWGESAEKDAVREVMGPAGPTHLGSVRAARQDSVLGQRSTG